MLQHLTIHDVALVHRLELDFGTGLTVITGESGAGKSVLLAALRLVLGDRASQTLIRPGAQTCEVVAEFRLEELPSVIAYLNEHEQADAADTSVCIVRRTAQRDGRSRAWINGHSVNLSALQELCSHLIEVHSQFELQHLLDTSAQLTWFDEFTGAAGLAGEVRNAFRVWRTKQAAYEAHAQRVLAANQRRELLEYQVAELNELDLGEDEVQQLTLRYKRLTHMQTTLATLASAQAVIDESVHADLVRINRELQQIDDNLESLSTARQVLTSAELNVEEAQINLREYAESLELDEQSLTQVSERLDAIHDLARKHRTPAGELFATAEALRTELKTIDLASSDLEDERLVVEDAKNRYFKSAKELSTYRRTHTDGFTEAVLERLAELALRDAKFELAFDDVKGERGLEKVEYLVSANPNYPIAPLRKVASGGELSRISLAIFVVAAARSKLPCLFLDEADIGIGGTTADMVGRMLRQLAHNTQVVCITHAPQVAALGNSHLSVQKSAGQSIDVLSIGGRERVEEVARMVGGREVNAESRRYARTLLDEAEDQREALGKH